MRRTLCTARAPRSARTARRILGAALALGAAMVATLALPKAAHAARELLVPAGEKGTLAIDQISGFRASMVDGVTYAGPIGFMGQQLAQHDLGQTTTTTLHRNTFWLTPSADIFVIDHLSVGGLFEYSTTWSSLDFPVNNNTTQTRSFPQTTSLTFLPRVGYLLSINDRFAIWPRVGVGYAHHETVTGNDPTNAQRNTISAPLAEIDVGLVYRINETFFVRGAPDFVFSFAGNHSIAQNGTTVSADASLLQISAVFGVGVFLDVF